MNTRQETGLLLLVAILAALVVSGGSGPSGAGARGPYSCPGPVQVTWQGREMVLCRGRVELPAAWPELGQRCAGVQMLSGGTHLVVPSRPGSACQTVPMNGQLRLDLGMSLLLNQATAADLEALPGIGPELARRIISKRRQLGHFGDQRQLLQVKGIGPARLRRILPYLNFAAAESPLDDSSGQPYNTSRKTGVPEGSASRDLDSTGTGR